MDEVFRLSQVAPVRSAAGATLGRAIYMRNYWGTDDHDVTVECEDAEARELLGYAESSCPSAVSKVRRAFRLARIRIDDDDHNLLAAYCSEAAQGTDKKSRES
jgi:hypothetical protein